MRLNNVFTNKWRKKSEGEMLVGRKFVAYKNTMKSWEKPHEGEAVTQKQIDAIIQDVMNSMSDKTVQIVFE